jgi:hypothetical protein
VIPSARERCRQASRNRRLANPSDVEFALGALLGPASRDLALRARIPAAPTIAELVAAVYGHAPRGPERLARWLIEEYFLLDPPVPPSGGASN